MFIRKRGKWNKVLSIFSVFVISIFVAQAQENLAFVNGSVLGEVGFVKKDLYSIQGKLTFQKPSRVDSTIDLSGKYIIPPFGDAHTHNLDRAWQMSFLPKQYLHEGTFYVLNLTSKLDGAKKAASYFDKDSTIDVRFSYQGLTSTLGHPFMAYEPFAMGVKPEEWEENMSKIKASRLDENNAYIFLDSELDVQRKLGSFFKTKPDVVKIFLLNHQDYQTKNHNDVAGDHGLSIPVAKMVVKESHKRGLDVYAHVESSQDFIKGIKIGVDYFAHMPGYGWRGDQESYDKNYTSTKSLKLAAKKDIGIIPTLGQTLIGLVGKDSLAKVEFVKDFLIRYRKLGGKIYVGSDIFNQTLSKELDHFINLEVFDNLRLLKIFCTDTPRNIFPKRRIGLLKESYEASFLALDDNPLVNIQAIKKIHMRVKEGIILQM